MSEVDSILIVVGAVALGIAISTAVEVFQLIRRIAAIEYYLLALRKQIQKGPPT